MIPDVPAAVDVLRDDARIHGEEREQRGKRRLQIEYDGPRGWGLDTLDPIPLRGAPRMGLE